MPHQSASSCAGLSSKSNLAAFFFRYGLASETRLNFWPAQLHLSIKSDGNKKPQDHKKAWTRNLMKTKRSVNKKKRQRGRPEELKSEFFMYTRLGHSKIKWLICQAANLVPPRTCADGAIRLNFPKYLHKSGLLNAARLYIYGGNLISQLIRSVGCLCSPIWCCVCDESFVLWVLSLFPMISEGIHVLRLTSWFHRETWHHFTALSRSPYLQTLIEGTFVRKLRRQVKCG